MMSDNDDDDHDASQEGMSLFIYDFFSEKRVDALFDAFYGHPYRYQKVTWIAVSRRSVLCLVV